MWCLCVHVYCHGVTTQLQLINISKLAKTGHGPHSSTLVVICVVCLLFVLFYALFVCKCVLPPGDNPIAVNKYYIISNRICSEARGTDVISCLQRMPKN
jgi:hypothetical protein